MVLYHFTASTTSHLGEILRTGRIETTLGIHQDQRGPRVVWLTSEPEPAKQGWSVGISDPIKATAIVAVDIDDASPWEQFAEEHHVEKSWREGLASVGGVETWYVREHPVERNEFVAVVFRPLEPGREVGDGQ